MISFSKLCRKKFSLLIVVVAVLNLVGATCVFSGVFFDVFVTLYCMTLCDSHLALTLLVEMIVLFALNLVKRVGAWDRSQAPMG